MIRGHREGDSDGMLLVLMLDQDTGVDAAKSDSTTYMCKTDYCDLTMCQFVAKHPPS